MFNEGTGTFWNTGNGTNSGSATGYIPEAVWNQSGASGLGAGGGGVSAYFSKPAWQVGTGVPTDLARDVPDIAMNSSAAHDGVLYCVQGSCVNGFRNSDQTLSVVGGTSVAAPEFAGLLALVEQKTAGRLGNANPQIYGLANSTFYNNVFHDVTSGNNNSPCVQGSPNCPNGGSIGYAASTGYDLSTGWGSIDAFNLVNKWGLVPATGTGNSTGSNLTSTVLTTSAPTCGISGGSLALSIAVAASAANAPAPTGTVQILVDNAAVGAPVALANGTGTYTLNTAALSSGGHTVSAVYLGDSNFSGSKGSLSTDVVSSTLPDFSITPCTATASAASGGTAQGITFTATPFNGFTGPITFTALANVTLGGSYTFSVSPVVISGTSSGTTVLTLNAFQNNSTSTTNGLIKLGSNTHPSGLSGKRFLYGAGSGRRVRLRSAAHPAAPPPLGNPPRRSSLRRRLRRKRLRLWPEHHQLRPCYTHSHTDNHPGHPRHLHRHRRRHQLRGRWQPRAQHGGHLHDSVNHPSIRRPYVTSSSPPISAAPRPEQSPPPRVSPGSSGNPAR